MNQFNLPDLGEGLPDAQIVRWLVKEGDSVTLDQPMVEMETAKAVVEVPSPYQGKVTKLCGKEGDVIEVGATLVEFDGGDVSPTAEPQDTIEIQATVPSPSPSEEEEEEEPIPPKAQAASNNQAKANINEVFNLPDLGEGLPDAEIVRWLVEEGDHVKLDQPMVEMETAKAVVEVPSPIDGRIIKLHGQVGDVITVGATLVSFGDRNGQNQNQPESEASLELAIQSEAKVKPKVGEQKKQTNSPVKEPTADAATVVGAVQVGNQLVVESANAVVKALAKKLKVDWSLVTGSGSAGAVTQADVKQAKSDGKLITKQSASKPLASNEAKQISQPASRQSLQHENALEFKASPAVRAYARRLNVKLSACQPQGKKGSITKQDVDAASSQSLAAISTKKSNEASRSSPTISQGTTTTSVQTSSEPQSVRGVRRAMAVGMAKAHALVVPTTLVEDADISLWPKQDALPRYVRALVVAAKIEPALNAWFDGEKFERIIHPQVHIGIAIDSSGGLYVPVVHSADSKNADQIRKRVQELRQKIENKGLKQEDQQNATITLSNFGSIAGRYGTPVVSPPQVAILGTGRYRNELKLTQKGIENKKMLPLSLTFDHRACTGGEAARFLAAVIDDLQQPI